MRTDDSSEPSNDDRLFYEYKHAVLDDVAGGVDQRLVLREDEEGVTGQVRRLLELVAGDRPLADGRPVDGVMIERLTRELVGELLGFGPLEPLLADPEVSEIIVNRWDRVYERRSGELRLSSVSFRDDEHVVRTTDRLLASLGRGLDDSQPYLGFRANVGSAAGCRVYAVTRPIAVDGACLTIRKPECRLSLEDLVRAGTVSRAVADFLVACVEAKQNIIVGGGGRAGKTTLLNALASCIGDDERLITIESSLELQLTRAHLVRLESRLPDAEGKGEVTVHELLRGAFWMSPERVVVGECRGGETFHLLQLINTGHDGALTTVYAQCVRELLQRLENMVLMAGMELPTRAIREQIQAAVDLVVQVARLDDGRRKVVEIAEVTGMEGDQITTQSVFLYDRASGALLPTGIRPTCYRRITETAHGQALPADLFDRSGERGTLS